MPLHTAFFYGEGAAGGKALVATPIEDASVRGYEGSNYGDIIKLMLSNDGPGAVDTYARFRITQDPEQDENELIPILDNDAPIGTGTGHPGYDIGSKRVFVGQDFDAKGISAGGDVFALGVMMRFGASLGGINPANRIIHRIYNKGSDLTASVWSQVAQETGLDPLKRYAVVGMSAFAEDEPMVGGRLRVPSTGCAVGVVGGTPMMYFPERACIIDGNSIPVIEGFVTVVSDPWVIVAYELLSEGGSNIVSRPPVGSTVQRPTVGNVLSGVGSFFR